MKGCMLRKKDYVCFDWLKDFKKYSFVKFANSTNLVLGVGFFVNAKNSFAILKA